MPLQLVGRSACHQRSCFRRWPLAFGCFDSPTRDDEAAWSTESPRPSGSGRGTGDGSGRRDTNRGGGSASSGGGDTGPSNPSGGGQWRTTVDAALADIAVSGEVAEVTVVIGQRIHEEFVEAVKRELANRDVSTIIVDTGLVMNPDLKLKFKAAAENGTTIFGGSVTQVSGGQNPIFQIIISN